MSHPSLQSLKRYEFVAIAPDDLTRYRYLRVATFFTNVPAITIGAPSSSRTISFGTGLPLARSISREWLSPRANRFASPIAAR